MARILVVDDSATQMFTLKKICEKHGHEVITANDGAAGVETAKTELPDLILMDVVMPKLNGFQATRQITKNASTSHIPIILVTTKDQETDKVWGERIGAKRYVTKPVNEELLVKNINELLAHPG
jgi:twitching motility two-component system response regulator PilH